MVEQRANFQKSYSMRYALIASVCLFMGAWFLYDGLIGYPHKLAIAQEYETLAELQPEARAARWAEISTQRGWSSEQPEKKSAEIEEQIIGQYVWAGLSILVGLPALLMFLRSRGSWVESTANGLTTSWGQTLDFSQVTQLNKKRWADKGIAKATYKENGVTKRFVFDDFKYEREPIGRMLRTLEAGLTAEQIVGGPPEPPLTAESSEPSDAS